MKKLSIQLIILVTLFALSACLPAVQRLEGSQWRLVKLNGREVPAEVEITLEFKSGHTGGKGACNGYGADYQQTGNRLEIGPVVSTMMYCEGVMEIEQEYLKTFEQVKSFSLQPNFLSMQNTEGETLMEFSAVPI